VFFFMSIPMDATAAIDLSQAGIAVMKTGRDGRTKETVVTLSEDCRQVEWGQRKSPISPSRKAALRIKVKQAADRMLLLQEVIKIQWIPESPSTKRAAMVILVEDESSAATARTPRKVTKKGLKIHPALVISATKDGGEAFKKLYEALLALTPKNELAETPRGEEPILPTEEELAAAAERAAAEKAAAEKAAADMTEAQRVALVAATEIVEEVMTEAVFACIVPEGLRNRVGKDIEDRINALETVTGIDLDGDHDIGVSGHKLALDELKKEPESLEVPLKKAVPDVGSLIEERIDSLERVAGVDLDGDGDIGVSGHDAKGEVAPVLGKAVSLESVQGFIKGEVTPTKAAPPKMYVPLPEADEDEASPSAKQSVQQPKAAAPAAPEEAPEEEENVFQKMGKGVNNFFSRVAM